MTSHENPIETSILLLANQITPRLLDKRVFHVIAVFRFYTRNATDTIDSSHREEAQLPPLYPGMLIVGGLEAQLPPLHPVCAPPWAVGFVSLSIQE